MVWGSDYVTLGQGTDYPNGELFTGTIDKKTPLNAIGLATGADGYAEWILGEKNGRLSFSYYNVHLMLCGTSPPPPPSNPLATHKLNI